MELLFCQSRQKDLVLEQKAQPIVQDLAQQISTNPAQFFLILPCSCFAFPVPQEAALSNVGCTCLTCGGPVAVLLL